MSNYQPWSMADWNHRGLIYISGPRSCIVAGAHRGCIVKRGAITGNFSGNLGGGQRKLGGKLGRFEKKLPPPRNLNPGQSFLGRVWTLAAQTRGPAAPILEFHGIPGIQWELLYVTVFLKPGCLTHHSFTVSRLPQRCRPQVL